ncbi:MAG: hypothetical protein CM1200mP29_07410 [Verrucomicrobiota bacterium]|nr:MAG: hypothetical protein CM1200mP29_07410 [Verrucomicrobiota bacterium]
MGLIHHHLTRFANCSWNIRYFSQSQVCSIWDYSSSITCFQFETMSLQAHINFWDGVNEAVMQVPA